MSLVEDLEKEEAGTSLLEELANTPEEAREYTESEKWIPTEPGESIEGIVLETFSFEGKFKDAKTGTYPEIPGIVLKVDGDETPWSVVGLHGVLRQELDKADPQPGDRVAIIYSGEREGKEYSYQHYRMAIRRGGGSVKPVPASTKNAINGSARGGSTQHEPAAKAAPRRKPGQPKAAATVADDSDPDF